MKCIKCGLPATYIRYTQFAGNHPFCTSCAKEEKDFNRYDNYKQWEKIKMKKNKKEKKIVDLHNDDDSSVDEKGRVAVKINLSNEDLFILMIMAHEQDITFNKFCENVLRNAMQNK
mgnify:CR=1 FL=1